MLQSPVSPEQLVSSKNTCIFNTDRAQGTNIWHLRYIVWLIVSHGTIIVAVRESKRQATHWFCMTIMFAVCDSK